MIHKVQKISVKIKPNAKENKLLGWHDNYLKVAIKASPVDGKANKMLIEFIAQCFKVPKKQVKIITGETTQFKQIEIIGSQRS